MIVIMIVTMIVIMVVTMVVSMVLARLCRSCSCGFWPAPVTMAPASWWLPGPLSPGHRGLGGSLSGASLPEAWVSDIRA